MSRERVEGVEEIGKKLKTESSGCSVMGKRQTMLNTITPCAACKLLRRRCAEECPFSPYFSPHEPQKFAAVHKVFGASNVSKMLMEVPESQRADAANCLVYEANVRLRDPVYGCMGEISALQHQVQNLQAQLNAVRAEIITYKYREAAINIINASNDHAAVLAVSVAELPQAPTTPTLSPPAPTPPPPPSVAISSSSSAPSLYTSPPTTASYRSISNNHVPYFD
ncbi:LOB domain-containing protein 15-like [Primulina huaijiensis]|uniref:LOB domain-containing protein 15-like n=1 Tax=Primulina huaijiensis TaxID=1492673 RepID=UPI003CC70CAB